MPLSIHNITERGKIIVHMIVAVHAIVDGHKADTQLRETDFCVKAHFQIISAKSGHVLYHYHAYHAGLNIGQYFRKAGVVEIRTRVAVILINLDSKAKIFTWDFALNILFKNFCPFFFQKRDRRFD